MKIYVVTRGEYSDYSIITATLDRNLAEAVAKKFSTKYDEACVEEFDDAKLMLKPCWIVAFREDGSVEEAKSVFQDYYHYQNAGACWVKYGSSAVSVSVVADDVSSAIKIAAEKRAKFLAEKEGIV